MLINEKPHKTISFLDTDISIEIIDQTKLPHEFEKKKLSTLDDASNAIKRMLVRGAPLIGVTGAYGFVLGLKDDSSDEGVEKIVKQLIETRPTAVNLKWALNRMSEKVKPFDPEKRLGEAIKEAKKIETEDIMMCSSIGDYGMQLINKIKAEKGITDRPFNILTHCNAGWLATVDWGTALSPIYKSHRNGVDLHIWVDETRPRNQGASLTAFELKNEKIPHTVVVDNAGGYLMQNGQVDLVIVGSDRTTKSGDVCNKIGTYLKAISAKENNVPFYAALPISTIDWNLRDGVKEIPIEERSTEEISHIYGINQEGLLDKVLLVPENTNCYNPGFDVTPSKFITGLITERGIANANEEDIFDLYNDSKK